jgi:hypothetical protein
MGKDKKRKQQKATESIFTPLICPERGQTIQKQAPKRKLF